MRQHSCHACGGSIGPPAVTHAWLDQYCQDCHDELVHGKIAPENHPDVAEESDLDDDDLERDGLIDNVARAYEDDMPDATQYGYRDQDLDDT